MRLLIPFVAILATTWLPQQVQSQQQALFVKRAAVEDPVDKVRAPRQTAVQSQTSADQMVQNILHWLQGVYQQNSRRIRQQSREYLPPDNQTQKPRPFQTQPPVPVTQRPSYSTYPAPSTTQEALPPFTSQHQVTENGGPYKPSTDVTPPFVHTGYPKQDQPTPSFPTPTNKPTYPPTYTTTQKTTGYPYPSTHDAQTTYPTQRPTFATVRPTTNYPTQRPTFQTTNYPTTGYPTARPTTRYTTGYPSTNRPTYTQSTRTPAYTTAPEVHTDRPEENLIHTEAPGDSDNGGSENNGVGVLPLTPDDDDKHPPHIHAIDVQCAKDMMTINLEFNRKYDGIIYSKGYYNNPECRYVQENSGDVKYSFTVNLNSCGTEFINAFDTEGQSYLENTLVLQNEAGIQEVWDSIRAVRCLWEGNLNKALSVALSVGMLSQEIVTFSGDTAMARLDIQVGRGPFAPNANGLIKIGELMTLVVSVTGDPGFDIQVKDCRARDESGENVVALTDDNGCVLKPKLFGAFQKTRNTQNSGASIIAYAFFQAFKFPDVMDLTLECNVELCKTDCEVCPNPDQKLEPGKRRKRDVNNSTLGDPITMGKMLHVILPEDLTETGSIINLGTHYNEGVCMSLQGFVVSSAFLVTLLALSCIFSAYMWLTTQKRLNAKH